MKPNRKVAIVTGAGSGIGRSIALLFASQGVDVAVNDINMVSAENTCKEITKSGSNAIAVTADVSRPDDVDMMVNRVINEFGGIHILVNNAGIFDEGVPTVESSLDHWDRVVGIVLRGTYLCCRLVGKWMIEHGGGKIINISSVGGISGFAPRPAYGPAKAGVILLTRSLAAEWGKYNINVNCIVPGFVWTPMLEGLLKKAKADPNSIERQIPLGRLAQPQDVANAALFLASEEASYISGVSLPIDGGWLASSRAANLR
jgi:NAD(P)-dependent dehydrogenase (short-subunit alcohol dehydrogenase family)